MQSIKNQTAAVIDKSIRKKKAVLVKLIGSRKAKKKGLAQNGFDLHY
jgi:hypothetical protein